jgi:hypothetical protein
MHLRIGIPNKVMLIGSIILLLMVWMADRYDTPERTQRTQQMVDQAEAR